MEARDIDLGIRQYGFEEGVNITAIIDKKEAILIDCAFPKQARGVLKELGKDDIVVKKILLSHYHPDHAAGASIFAQSELMCSKAYENNFRLCQKSWDTENTYIEPTKVLKHNDVQYFHNFAIRVLEAPGHSKCGLISVIDDKVAHVGDLIMRDLYGKLALPGLGPDGSVKEHIESLEQMKLLNVEKIMLGHGQPIVGVAEIQREIDKLLYYLRNLKDSRGTISFERCIQGSIDEWSETANQFHEHNITKWNS